MAKSIKPDFLTEERLLACLMFLSQLRKNGVTNMFEIRLKLRHATQRVPHTGDGRGFQVLICDAAQYKTAWVLASYAPTPSLR